MWFRSEPAKSGQVIATVIVVVLHMFLSLHGFNALLLSGLFLYFLAFSGLSRICKFGIRKVSFAVVGLALFPQTASKVVGCLM